MGWFHNVAMPFWAVAALLLAALPWPVTTVRPGTHAQAEDEAQLTLSPEDFQTTVLDPGGLNVFGSLSYGGDTMDRATLARSIAALDRKFSKTEPWSNPTLEVKNGQVKMTVTTDNGGRSETVWLLWRKGMLQVDRSKGSEVFLPRKERNMRRSMSAPTIMSTKRARRAGDGGSKGSWTCVARRPDFIAEQRGGSVAVIHSPTGLEVVQPPSGKHPVWTLDANPIVVTGSGMVFFNFVGDEDRRKQYRIIMRPGSDGLAMRFYSAGDASKVFCPDTSTAQDKDEDFDG